MTILFAAFAAFRYIGYAALMGVFGASLLVACCGIRSLDIPAQLALRRGLRLAMSLAFVATLCLLPLQTAMIAEDARALWDGGMLATVASQTRYGQAWILRAVLALLALIIVWRLRPGMPILTVALVSGLALAPLGLSGHTAMSEGGLGVAHAVNDILHIWSAAFWFGSLGVFLLFLKAWEEPARRMPAAAAMRRFSRAGHIAVAGVLVTGVINAVLILRASGVDMSSAYQRVLLCKMVLAGAMTALAIANRYRWVPRLRQDRHQALRHIRRNTVAEWLLGGAVLLIVACLGLMSPD